MKAYLEKLVHVLNDEHIEALAKIPMKTSKLKKYLNYLIGTRKASEMSKSELLGFLKVDDRLLRKMKSVLLRRCYEALVPGEGLPLLDLLSRYRLQENFERQLLIEEQKIKNNKSDKIKSEFYELALEYMIRLPYSTANLKSLENLSIQNLKYAKGHAKELNALTNRALILVVHMIQNFFQREIRNLKNNSYQKSIDEIAIGVKVHKDSSLESLEHFCRAMYAYTIKMDFKESEKLFTSLYRDNKAMKLLPQEFRNAVSGLLATSLYYNNDFDRSIEMFEKYVRDKNVFFFNHPHLLSRLAEVYMITGRMNEAKNILDKHLNRFLQTGEPDAVQVASIAYTKYFMLTENLEEAYKYLEIAREHLNKKFFINHDLEIRLLELLYFLLSGDVKFAQSILARTLKFLREKRKSRDLEKQVEKYELLGRMCRNKMKRKSLAKFSDEIQKKFIGADTIYGKLIESFCLS